MIDFHIITRPGREFATMIANSQAALDWIEQNIGNPLSKCMIILATDFVPEYRNRAIADGMSIKLSVRMD
jgi:hypothetical protein